MKQQSRAQIKKGLLKMIPDLWMKDSEEYDGHSGGIWSSGEDGKSYKGIPVFDYYEESNYLMMEEIRDRERSLILANEEPTKMVSSYESGVHLEIYKWLDERGWYAEWNDPGTIFLWKN